MARRRPARRRGAAPAADISPRIIGGKFRGTRLQYGGDPRTRPMKDRVREAAFNLIGPLPPRTLAIDLFAGTGALALEAISRGAERAVMIERHFPTAKVIEQNVERIEAGPQCQVLTSDAFHWVRQQLGSLDAGSPWLVLCSPPYLFYEERQQEMLWLLRTFQDACPAGSTLVAEFERASFSAELLPQSETWDARAYPPAVIAVWTKPAEQ